MMCFLERYRYALVFAITCATPILSPLSYSTVAAADCVANNNLAEIAQTYIGRCRLGSINREFPGELLSLTLGAIKAGTAANYKTGWKLLNDTRFAK